LGRNGLAADLWPIFCPDPEKNRKFYKIFLGKGKKTRYNKE
jgi:hypothetical protein